MVRKEPKDGWLLAILQVVTAPIVLWSVLALVGIAPTVPPELSGLAIILIIVQLYLILKHQIAALSDRVAKLEQAFQWHHHDGRQ